MPAQTNDWARLTIGFAAGPIGATELWDVPNQTILSSNYLLGYGPDVFHLHRQVRSGLMASGQFTRFSGPHFGLTVDLEYLGLRLRDGCNITVDGGDVTLIDACHQLVGHVGAPSTTGLQAGAVVRPWSQTLLQPYFKGMAGVALTPTSTIYMQSFYIDLAGQAVLTIYPDPFWKTTRPMVTFAAGISTAPTSGVQARLEIRELWLSLPVVTGSTQHQLIYPPHKSMLAGFPSIILGLDVVLEKRRGHRY